MSSDAAGGQRRRPQPGAAAQFVERGPSPSQAATAAAIALTVASLEARALRQVPFNAAAYVGVGAQPDDRAAAERALAAFRSVEVISVEVCGAWAQPGDLVALGLAGDGAFWGECQVIVDAGRVVSLTLPDR